MAKEGTKVSLTVLFGVVVLIAIITGAAVYYLTRPAEPTPPEEWKIGAIWAGTWTDYGWALAGYEAVTTIAERYNASLSYTEFAAWADAPRILRDYCEDGANIIWSQGAEYGDAVMEVAPDYPDVYFIAMGAGEDVQGPNILRIFPKHHESAYIIGILAGLMTETNKLGYISGLAYPWNIRNTHAYEAAAKSVNPDVELFVDYVGSWEDPTTGKELGDAQFALGVDIISQEADLSGRGIMEAATERNREGERVFVLGTYADQAPIAPEITLSSNVADMCMMFDKVMKDLIAGTFTPGDWEPGYPYCHISPYHGLADEIPQSVKDQVEEVAQKIINGEIEVPASFEPYK